MYEALPDELLACVERKDPPGPLRMLDRALDEQRRKDEQEHERLDEQRQRPEQGAVLRPGWRWRSWAQMGRRAADARHGWQAGGSHHARPEGEGVLSGKRSRPIRQRLSLTAGQAGKRGSLVKLAEALRRRRVGGRGTEARPRMK